MPQSLLATDAGTNDGAYSNSFTASGRPAGPANDTSAAVTPNISPYLTAMSGITSAFAAFQAGKINQELDNYNANLARLQGQQALQAGELQANNRQAKENIIEGQTRASFGAQGVSSNTGTARAVQTSQRAVSEMDKVIIETNARRAAYGYQVRAAGDQLAGDLSAIKGRTGVATSLLYTGAQEELEQDPRYSGFRGRGATIP